MIDLTIRSPGVYDIPMAAYHAQICDGVSLSRSDLWTIRNQTPAHFWAGSNLNPAALPNERTKSLDFGAAAHALLLEGDLPTDLFAVAPYGDFRTKIAQEWRDEQHAAGRSIVRISDLQQIEQMAEALAQHPLIQQGLFRGEIERSIFWKHDGVWLKSRPDVIPTDTILADYKTVANASPYAVSKAIANYGYHLQLAMAIDGIRVATGRDISIASLVVQEKEPPYVVQVYPLADEWIAAGRAEYIAAIQRFNQCMADNFWPGYTDETLFMPGYKQLQLEAEGLLSA